MVIARLIALVLLVVVGAVLLLFVVTKDRKWLRIFGRILQASVVIALIFIGIFFLERFLLVF